ncbi:hypothetical protein [Leptospira kmetyi]|uniref:Uncharacterized protein n=1 Tax=Leptospira kmetyi TaxID=408139 RepID=A0ABX4NA66_9LEPT|nr:hypothetical protein [Leptospira kmetyi]PJZ28310.1 hypothetical protein CH378_18480 [Leptospira kmetyi]
MKIYDYRIHRGVYVTESQQWLSYDPETESECIFLMLSLKNGELLREYYDSLPTEDHENHNHLKSSLNNFRFTDGDKYNTGLAIQHKGNEPIGLLLPLRSFEREFCFDRVFFQRGSSLHSKEALKYSEKIYRFILRLDSLMIALSEKAATIPLKL